MHAKLNSDTPVNKSLPGILKPQSATPKVKITQGKPPTAPPAPAAPAPAPSPK